MALTDSNALSAWFMPTDFKPEPGYRFYFKSSDSVIITGEVLEIITMKKLVYSWKRDGLKNMTTVTWTIQETSEGTLLRLEHDGFDDDASILFGMHIAGWDNKFYKLHNYFNS